MDIQKNGNTIHIKANDYDNQISVERNAGKTEVYIDGEKSVFKGNNEIVIDAGGGNDNITVSNLASGKSGAPQVTIIGGEGDDTIQTLGNVKVIDNKGKNRILDGDKGLGQSNLDARVNGYIAEIETVLAKKNPLLEKADKEEILEILKRSNCDGSLIDLAKKLDKENKLVPLYRDMGTLVNQGDTGAAMSAVMMVFTAGFSIGVEAEDNRANDMKEYLKKSNVPEEILKKLN